MKRMLVESEIVPTRQSHKEPTKRENAIKDNSHHGKRGNQIYRSFETGEELRVERVNQNRYVVHLPGGAEQMNGRDLKSNFAYVREE